LNHAYSKIGETSRRHRPKLVSVFRIIGGFLILLLIIEGFGILIEYLSWRPVVTEWGTMEKGFWADVIFLRDETLITAPVDGKLVLQRKSGDRVAEGEIIATIKTPILETKTDGGFQDSLQKLIQGAKALQADLQRSQHEYVLKKAQIHALKRSIHLSQLCEDLTFIEQEKRTILRNIEENHDQIELITKNFKAWQNGTTILQAEQPGYLWYQFDKVESRFTPDHFAELTEADFKKSYSVQASPKDVNPNEVIGKIISPFHQLICFIIDTNEIKRPAEGAVWWFKSDDTIFPCSVVNESILPNEKVILGLDDVSMLPKFMPNRRGKIFIIYKRVSGIIIPVQALYKKGQTDIVKVVKGDTYEETKVVVRENDGVKAIIDGIDYGKTIISR